MQENTQHHMYKFVYYTNRNSISNEVEFYLN